MTIIAAMWESDDAILIAADSGQTETTTVAELRSIYENKLQSHAKAPLAWGTAGNPTIGIHRFSTWLRDYQWPPAEWLIFQNEVATKLAQLNGEQRAICKLAGIEAEEDHLADALIVGWLDTPSIFTVDNRGILTIIERDQEFQAIGAGGVHAILIHTAFKAVALNVPPTVKLRGIMQIAADKAQHCSRPIYIWRVTRDGVEEIEQTKERGGDEETQKDSNPQGRSLEGDDEAREGQPNC